MPAPFIFMRWSASDGVRERHNPVHLLGSCPGFGFEVPAGKKYGITIALGSYLEGFQTNGLDGRYLYTRYFKGLADVLKTALDNAGNIIGVSTSRSTASWTTPLSLTISASSSLTPPTATTEARSCSKSKASLSGSSTRASTA